MTHTARVQNVLLWFCIATVHNRIYLNGLQFHLYKTIAMLMANTSRAMETSHGGQLPASVSVGRDTIWMYQHVLANKADKTIHTLPV